MNPTLKKDLENLIYRWKMPRMHPKYAEFARGQEKCAQELSELLKEYEDTDKPAPDAALLAVSTSMHEEQQRRMDEMIALAQQKMKEAEAKAKKVSVKPPEHYAQPHGTSVFSPDTRSNAFTPEDSKD